MKSWLKWIAGLALLVAVPLVLRATVLRPAPIPVRVYRVDRGSVESTVTNSRAGTLRSRSDSRLSMETAGRVVAIRHLEGETVAAGDVLIELDTTEARETLALAERELTTVREMLAESQANCDSAAREVERNERLLSQGAISPEQVDQLRSRRDAAEANRRAAEARVAQQEKAVELAQARLDRGTLRAPFAGVLAERTIDLGEWAVPGQPVLRLIDLSLDHLYVHAEIDEVDLARVRVDLPARISVDPLRGRSFRGRIVRVAPYVSDVEQQNRTLEVEVAFEETPPEEVLKPGISADVELILDRVDDALRIPAYALIEGRYALVANGGHAVRREVEVGLRNWEFVEVRTGLSAGDPVILTLDREDVKDGARVAAQVE